VGSFFHQWDAVKITPVINTNIAAPAAMASFVHRFRKAQGIMACTSGMSLNCDFRQFVHN
jgi:hypothetical protein